MAAATTSGAGAGSAAATDAVGALGAAAAAGSGAASAGFVYKLVAIQENSSILKMRPVKKRSEGKTSEGGQKFAKRTIDSNGMAVEESIFLEDSAQVHSQSAACRSLQSEVMSSGKIVYLPTLKTLDTI